MRPLKYSLFLFCAFLELVIAQTLTNITIDDNDSRITYAGRWDSPNSHTSSRDYGGSHMLLQDRSGSATLTFTGVAVYYLAPKWPYAVDSYIALDGGTPQLVDMTVPATPRDPPNGEESVAYAVLWSATGLSNTAHRVVVTVGASFGIVDGFIFTTQSTPTTTQRVTTPVVAPTTTQRVTTPVVAPTTTQPVPTSVVTERVTEHVTQQVTSVAPAPTPSVDSASSSPTSSDSGTSNSTVVVAVSVAATAVCIVLLVGIIILIRRKRKAARAHLDTPAYGDGGGGGGVYPVSGDNYHDTPSSAVPLNDPNAYMYPYGGNNNSGHGTNSPEMDMANVNARNSRYSAMAYSDRTATSRGSLSAQQMAFAGTAPYNQDTYGMHPVANRAIVPPNTDAGGGYNPGPPAGAYVPGGAPGGYNATGYDNSSYYGDSSSGFNAAAAYAGVGPSTSGGGRSDQSPSPVSGKAHFGGIGKHPPSISSSMREQNRLSGYDPRTVASLYAGTSSPPPYAPQRGPSVSQRSLPPVPFEKEKGSM